MVHAPPLVVTWVQGYLCVPRPGGAVLQQPTSSSSRPRWTHGVIVVIWQMTQVGEYLFNPLAANLSVHGQTLLRWFIDDYIFGPTGGGNVNVSGFFL